MSEEIKLNKAVIMASIVILLCLISLTGATLALFTSNPDDGKIGIITTSGNVKIDIVSADDTTDSLQGDVLNFDTESADHEVLFEPGATFYTQGFKVKNVGSIPVNFRVYISDDDSLDMTAFTEAFDFYITTDPDDPDAMIDMINFVGRVEVDKCSDETFFLVIKMKETASNEFQNQKYTGIGITVCAVQGNVTWRALNNE